MSRTSSIQALAGLAVVTLAVFAAASWPLPRMAGSAIPSSVQNIEQPPWRVGISGDHLQLLFHFDAMRDMLTGRVPWMHLVHEFNRGDDAERYRPGAYFFPMSGFYALLASWLGQAGAWNFSMWVSVWLSAFFTWRWLYGFTRNGWALALAVSIVLWSPFRWISLFGGSPAGFALLWVPFLAWMVDAAVRRPSWGAGFGVGAACLFCFWADLQTFYFAMLSIPLFALLSALGGARGEGPVMTRYARLLPGLILFGGAIGWHYRIRKAYLAGSTMVEGRTWEEIRLFSPSRWGFLAGGAGPDDSVYIGIAALAAAVCALCFLLYRRWYRLAAAGLVLAIVLGCALALGVNGPGNGAVLRAAREHLPYYGMIRQPFKIFAVIPFWLAWLTAIGWSQAATGERYPRRLKLAAVVLMAGMAGQFMAHYGATLSVLEPHQPAYQRVAEEAALDNLGPARAMVIPLWPGEAADTSLPLYHAHRYDIRLINGYSPVVRQLYHDDVFRRLESMNQGEASDAQLDYLLERGIRFLIVHEDQYPERVSPFPVSEALRRLHTHQRLTRLIQAGPVHAFRILPEPAAGVEEPLDRIFPALFPARRWESDQQTREGGVELSDALASGGRFWRGKANDEESHPWMETRGARVAALEDGQWWLRVRGEGIARFSQLLDEELIAETERAVSSDEWQWITLPFYAPDRFAPSSLRTTVIVGTVDVDLLFLGAGSWSIELPAEGLWMPAQAFFRAGESDPDGRSVVFRRDYDPDRIVLYGPRLPLAPGSYRAEWEVSSSAPPGTELALVRVHDGRAATPWESLVAGTDAALRWTSDTDLPVTFQLRYLRRADLTVHGVRVVAETGGEEVRP